MKTRIVLAMHGVPPLDFPMSEIGEIMSLDTKIAKASTDERARLIERKMELDIKVRDWPRTPTNDPFHNNSLELGKALGKVSGYKVEVGFIEFCSPSLETALENTAENGPERIVVITTMMTQGGGHSEVDIMRSIQSAKDKYPNIEFIHAWPFNTEDIAGFLKMQLNRFL